MSDPADKHTSDTTADLETLRCTTAADFDGHTEFHRLSPLERLAWLDEAVAFIASAKAARQSSVSPAGIYPGP